MKEIKREKVIKALEEFLECSLEEAKKFYKHLEILRYSED